MLVHGSLSLSDIDLLPLCHGGQLVSAQMDKWIIVYYLQDSTHSVYNIDSHIVCIVYIRTMSSEIRWDSRLVSLSLCRLVCSSHHNGGRRLKKCAQFLFSWKRLRRRFSQNYPELNKKKSVGSINILRLHGYINYWCWLPSCWLSVLCCVPIVWRQ